jgi:hypothetical protein
MHLEITLSQHILSRLVEAQFLVNKPYTRFHSFVGSDDRSLLLTRYWKPLAGSISFERDVDQGKPLPHSLEPREWSSNYVRRVGWRNPQPRSLEYCIRSSPYTRHVIELRELTNDIEPNTITFYWKGTPWFLPKPCPIVKILLET